ncbi:dipeptidyl-peptidase 3 family protein [Pseudidiomarina andamanensis]|uniref:Zn-dependent hydrolase n=1 Tax=Pseudidiomarina andamanensis TaxID=1940690 RepID=A0AA92ET44_9GAMM|nr:Zn-dependent hydrolase [Pseudidiomarina andamanensis]MDS0219577.1 Zn-dependent hydrolase [Pseudidiomarina andamanensis]QGT95794.1 Zn-dependent hydrolase [Pseudidiomarina andamanensis]
MIKTIRFPLTALAVSLTLLGCSQEPAPVEKAQSEAPAVELVADAKSRLDIYYPMDLTADLSHLSERQRHVVELLIEASEIMDDLFWQQAYGASASSLLNRISDENVKNFAAINYGPWDRLNNDKPFLTGFGEKPAGANFYPSDMTKEEFEQAEFEGKIDLYTLVRRNDQGELYAVPYNEAYRSQLEKAAALLREAAEFTEDEGFKNYLTMRADAFLSNDYQPSDFAWMDMTNNAIDVVIGPIESYEDQLYGYRAAFESYVLIKDLEWSEKLAVYAQYLPELQQNLPVPAEYKAEVPGAGAQLNAYDVVYYAGHSNAGSKTIAINLPNDEEVQLQKGTRRLQLKNAMRAKFDAIMLPIADELIVPEQRQHITFDAFFANTMFHEVAHGLGIKNLVGQSGTVREALKEHASALEEGKADILGLYMVTQLLEAGVITEGVLEDYYTTFLAGIFRSVRFGASSAHGKANMIRFNYFEQAGAFSRNEQGQYSVNMDAMRAAMNSLSEKILTLQGDGDYQGVGELFDTMGNISPQLQADLDRLSAADIPVDITFRQGKSVLGL